MYEMASKISIGLHMLAQFNRVVTLDVRVKVSKFQERFCIVWSGFCEAFKMSICLMTTLECLE